MDELPLAQVEALLAPTPKSQEELDRQKLRRRVVSRNSNYKNLYGITLLEYQSMLREQQGACALCRRKPEKRLHVDHDHETGKVRGLVCQTCNKNLAVLESWIKRTSGIERVLKYLDL